MRDCRTFTSESIEGGGKPLDGFDHCRFLKLACVDFHIVSSWDDRSYRESSEDLCGGASSVPFWRVMGWRGAKRALGVLEGNASRATRWGEPRE